MGTPIENELGSKMKSNFRRKVQINEEAYPDTLMSFLYFVTEGNPRGAVKIAHISAPIHFLR